MCLSVKESVDSQVKSGILLFPEGFLDLQSELCALHLQQLGKKSKSICEHPFGLHHGQRARSIIGAKLKELNQINPSLIKPNDALCVQC